MAQRYEISDVALRKHCIRVSLNQILMEPLRLSKCNKSLIFIDACASRIDEQIFSREFIADMNPSEFIDFVRSSNYRAMFLSCSRGEKSYSSSMLGHGIWTHFLLKVLKGEAPEAIEQERFITSTSLQNYLSKVVPDFIKSSTDIRETQKPWAEVSSSNTFIIYEIPTGSTANNTVIDYIFIPERLIIDFENDLIMAPLRGLENDGRSYPMYDFEGLEEVDMEAFCIRISKVKSEIKNLLEEIIDFLMEYEWEEEVIFEKSDDKFMISAYLYEDKKVESITISLSLQLHISGLRVKMQKTEAQIPFAFRLFLFRFAYHNLLTNDVFWGEWKDMEKVVSNLKAEPESESIVMG